MDRKDRDDRRGEKGERGCGRDEDIILYKKR